VKRICLLGSFSGRNIGDDAILRGVINVFEQTIGDFRLVLLSKFPKYFSGFSPFLTIKRSRISLLSLNTFMELFKSDVFLITQSNLFSQKLFNPFYNRVITYFLFVVVNKLFFRKPIGLFFGGIGPLYTPLSESLVKRIVNHLDFLIFRERQSLKYLEKWGIDTNIHLASDIALFCGKKDTNLTDNIYQKINNKTAIGININKYFSGFSETSISKAEFFKQLGLFLQDRKDAFIIFMPSDTEDIEVTKDFIVSTNLDEDAWVLVEKCDPEEYIQILSRCDFFIGTRMHSMIMSAVANTPFLGVNYNPKVRDFMKQLDCEEYCLELAEVEAERLNQKFTTLVNTHTEVQNKITHNVEIMQKNILAGIRILSDESEK
jgi:polysaccharide pyruvyl transferase WcaK-like protein